jgi:signal peptidase I
MTVITDRRGKSPDPIRDPGTARVRKGDAPLFYVGLLALTALLVFGTLSVMALLPMLIPGYTSASITSGSMTPVLHIGDVVIAADHGGRAVEPESIVVFEDPRKHDLVTHRIVEVNPNGSYSTKGDANGNVDPEPIPAANIRGEARWIVPFVGLPRVWAAQDRWVLVALTIAAAATTLWLSRFAFDSRYDPWRHEYARIESSA